MTSQGKGEARLKPELRNNASSTQDEHTPSDLPKKLDKTGN